MRAKNRLGLTAQFIDASNSYRQTSGCDSELVTLKVERAFDGIRADPSISAILHKLGIWLVKAKARIVETAFA